MSWSWVHTDRSEFRRSLDTLALKIRLRKGL